MRDLLISLVNNIVYYLILYTCLYKLLKNNYIYFLRLEKIYKKVFIRLYLILFVI